MAIFSETKIVNIVPVNNKAHPYWTGLSFGRGERIRTSDPLLPNQGHGIWSALASIGRYCKQSDLALVRMCDSMN